MLKRANVPRGILGGPSSVAYEAGTLWGAARCRRATRSLPASKRPFTVNRDRVTLSLADGTRVDGDLLVGATGSIEHPPAASSVRASSASQPHRQRPRCGDGAVGHLEDVDSVLLLGQTESAFIRASATGIYWFCLRVAEELVCRRFSGSRTRRHRWPPRQGRC